MEIGTPFIVDTTEEQPQNNNTAYYSNSYSNSSYDTDKSGKSEDIAVPFEFSRSRMWSENFYSPEIGCGHSIAALGKELGEIRILLSDIKDMLSDIFELK